MKTAGVICQALRRGNPQRSAYLENPNHLSQLRRDPKTLVIVSNRPTVRCGHYDSETGYAAVETGKGAASPSQSGTCAASDLIMPQHQRVPLPPGRRASHKHESLILLHVHEKYNRPPNVLRNQIHHISLACT